MNAFVPLKTLPLPILTTSKTCGEGREGGSMWGPPVPWQEWGGLQRKYNVAFFKMEKAMFEREVLATELDNHEYHRKAAICLAQTSRTLYVMARDGTIE